MGEEPSKEFTEELEMYTKKTCKCERQFFQFKGCKWPTHFLFFFFLKCPIKNVIPAAEMELKNQELEKQAQRELFKQNGDVIECSCCCDDVVIIDVINSKKPRVVVVVGVAVGVF